MCPASPIHQNPMFPESGGTARALFNRLGHRLDPEIWTAGLLSCPNDRVLRSEIRHNEKSTGRGLVDFPIWVALRLDPIELGRIFYQGQVPKDNDPSYREVGAIFLERAYSYFRDVSKAKDRVGLPPWTELLGDVNLGAKISGLRFWSSAFLNAPDYRYSYLQLSWIGSSREPVHSKQSQTLVVNQIISDVLRHRDEIRACALTRYPRGFKLDRESMVDFSDEELKLVGSSRPEFNRYNKLVLDPTIPDRFAPEREEYDNAGPVELVEPFDDYGAIPDEELVMDLGLEEADISLLRERLSTSGVHLQPLTDDLNCPSVPHLVETHFGVRVVLEMKFNSSDNADRLAEALSRSLNDDIQEARLDNIANLYFTRVCEVGAIERCFLTIDALLPQVNSSQVARRAKTLGAIGETIIKNKVFFTPR